MTYISTTCAEVIIEVKVSGASSVDGTDCKQLPVSNQLRVPQWYTVQKNRKWNLYYATISTKLPLPPFGLIMNPKRVILQYVWSF